MGNKDALFAVANANDKASAAIYNYEQTGVGNRDQMLELIDAQEKLAGATGSTTDALRVNQAAADNEAAANGKMTHVQLAAVAADEARIRSLGGTAGQAHQVVAAYDKLPASKRTKVSLDDYASSKIAKVQTALNKLHDVNVSIYTSNVSLKPGGSVYDSQVPKAPGSKAVGTGFWRGGLTYLAENGPELVDLPAGSKVRTAPQTTAAMSGGSGGDVINVYVTQPLGTPADIGEAVHQALMQRQRQTGPLGFKS
jgi:hypothetical protein